MRDNWDIMSPATRPRWYHVDYGGVVLGLIFGALSLTPSLLPRPIVAQGIIAGLSFAFGYMVGALLWFLAKRIVRWRPPDAVQRFAWWYLCTAWIIGAVVLAILVVQWQNDVRVHVGAPTISTENWVAFTVAALITSVSCLVVGRIIRLGARAIHGWFHRRLAPRFSPRTAVATSGLGTGVIVTACIAALVALLVTSGLAFVDYTYARKYAAPNSELNAPSSDYRSVGLDSSIAWEDLGRDGADILSTAPSAARIAEVTGAPAIEPVRVYVGISNAPTPATRADAAVAELERLGAGERAVLVVAGTTGTGWLDPAAIDAIEYLHGGNTALVAVQYDDTPSWRSSIFQPEVPVIANRALFNAVHAWWSQLPEGERPLLIAYGLSLGSTGIQGAFNDAADLLDRVDGAVFAGTPSNTDLWREITMARESGTPIVLPVYQDGRNIRFFSQIGDFSNIEGAWDHPRIAYLQHGSDPVTWGSLGVFLREPEWLKSGQRSDQVSPHMRWIPIVSGLQGFGDFMLGQAVPDDAGHKYGNVMVDAWIAVTGTAPDLPPGSVERIREVIAGYGVVLPADE